jgi:hypothetical protein
MGMRQFMIDRGNFVHPVKIYSIALSLIVCYSTRSL